MIIYEGWILMIEISLHLYINQMTGRIDEKEVADEQLLKISQIFDFFSGYYTQGTFFMFI